MSMQVAVTALQTGNKTRMRPLETRLNKKVQVEHLEIGMYIDRLDRRWLGTPFLLKGLHLKTVEDIEAIRRLCNHVFIDIEKSSCLRTIPSANDESQNTPVITDKRQGTGGSGHVGYDHHDLTALGFKFDVAVRLRQRAKMAMDTLQEDVRAGKSIAAEDVKQLVTGLVDSIICNPNALLWLTQLKSKDDYTVTHSINVCILSLAFGRHLGLQTGDMQDLGLSALLHDIGKLKIPIDVLNKPDVLSSEEFELIKQHTIYGREILLETNGISAVSVDVAYGHHERLDGSGYPRGLKQEQIGIFSRIVGIVDCYDAFTTERVYKRGLSSSAATRLMYEGKGQFFDLKLVESFIQCLGIYPVGALVETNKGDVGAIISANTQQKLKPIVMLILDKDKKKYTPLKIIDLYQMNSHGIDITIKRILDPGSYGINVADYIKEIVNIR